MRALVIASLALLTACGEDEVSLPSPPLREGPCPHRMVHLADIGACIDRYEAVLEGGGAAVTAEPARGRLPANGPSWITADRACRNAGLRLCTGVEWERACGGAERREYPYEGPYEPRRCNTIEQDTPASERRLAQGGAFERCVTPEGVYDLSGNIGEWIADSDGTGTLREQRGGSWANPEEYVRCRFGHPAYQPPEVEFRGQGLRCCADARPRQPASASKRR